jgi:hypothetical protein
MSDSRAEWHSAPDFAEIAEALGVTTKQIMMVQNPNARDTLVIYTVTTDPGDTLLHSVRVQRGVDGILFRATRPVPHPGMWEEIVERANLELPGIIESKLNEKETDE